MAQDETDRLRPEETERRFEETVRRMLKTPPKPQQEMKLGKRRRSRTARERRETAQDDHV